MEIEIKENIFNANDQLAADNKAKLDREAVLALNLMASPGAGKTSLILQSAKSLSDRLRLGVIEGDIASSIDADNVRSHGIPTELINTGGACHLDANMIQTPLAGIDLPSIDVLFIENVGNLVCPAEFNLGEHLKIVILSAAEGADKPYKYPLMFKVADAIVINKIDLMPYIDFRTGYFYDGVRALNQQAPVFELSAKTGEGVDAWASWLLEQWNERFGQGHGEPDTSR
ncbi:MAG: hydrogenase nickel incorporation protein HypB [Chloroflexi bacterium]|nr:hydrogenase nickel incorporation protein HypB [Chloroflexota bacterium]